MSLFSWLRTRKRRQTPRPRPAFRPRLEALEGRTVPSQVGLTVTSLADSGVGTLRAAITSADAGGRSDKFTIGFAVSGTIDLQSPLPDLNNSVAIQGPGANSLTVQRDAAASFTSAIVTVDAGQTASLSGLTIANGNVAGIPFGLAGGIDNDGTLTVANCAVVNNSDNNFNSFGGGIYNAGTLTVSGSTLSGNTATFGGGIYNAGTLRVNASTLSGNTAFAGGGRAAGGGIENIGSATVSNCTLSGNTGGGIESFSSATVSNCILSGNTGGGIANIGRATIQGCTLSGNSAITGDIGGGILNTGALTVTNSTLSGNSAADGGGIANFGGTLTVSSCSLSGNTATNFGGGIYNTTSVIGLVSGSVTVRDSTLNDNSAAEGGGIYNDASTLLAVRGSTFSGNTASDSGGGIYNLGTGTLQESTLSGNTAGSAGGGVFNAAFATLAIDDSVVCDNSAPLGADLFNLGLATINDSTVGVINS